MKIAMFDGKNLVKRDFKSVSDLKWFVEKSKLKFRDENAVRGEKKDFSYERYCEELDALVMKAVLAHLGTDYLCSKCLPGEHEQEFCRCEERNMRIAKLNREPFKDNKGQGHES
jgi:hypothetical protein